MAWQFQKTETVIIKKKTSKIEIVYIEGVINNARKITEKYE